MAVYALPVDQRVIDIDSRRFSSIEKAIVELVTNCDDSYLRLEDKPELVTGTIVIGYERHQKGALLSVTDCAEGMAAERLNSILTYGGAHSSLAKDGVGGRGYFGRGLKKAIYGLGYGWIETICENHISRVDLYQSETGEYLFDDGSGYTNAKAADYLRFGIPEGSNGTKISIIVDNPQVNIPFFNSLMTSITHNVYLRDILMRRNVSMVNLNEPKKLRIAESLVFIEPQSEILIGPYETGTFSYNGETYTFSLTLKRAKDSELILKGDERTNGLIVMSGNAILDCQFFNYENQLGTEFLFGSVICDDLSKMLAKGHPIISDEREGLNHKELFVKAFSDGVSSMLMNIIKSEQIRLSHVERTQISQRTQLMIETILKKMNDIAAHELGIQLISKHDSSSTGIHRKNERDALYFTSPFYYRKAAHPFNIILNINKHMLGNRTLIKFDFQLPNNCTILPHPEKITLKDIPNDGRFIFKVMGSTIGTKGTMNVIAGKYTAFCEIVIAEDSLKKEPIHQKEGHSRLLDRGTVDMFKGYELRNLGNDKDRAIYSPEERLIIINTEAPTVRLYVDGQGRFKDGARLLLAELFLDVITDELAYYYVEQNVQHGKEKAFHDTKRDMILRYGVEIHSILLG